MSCIHHYALTTNHGRTRDVSIDGKSHNCIGNLVITLQLIYCHNLVKSIDVVIYVYV